MSGDKLDRRLVEPEHGTEQGYKWHTRHDWPPCDECRAAHAAYQRNIRSRAKGI